MIITEDGILDYLLCPMRYAFLWHYNIDPAEPRRTAGQRLRLIIQTFYKLAYNTALCYRTVRETIHKHRGTALLPEGQLWVYAETISNYKVRAYRLPTRVPISSSEVIGAFDGLRTNKDGGAELIRVNAWPRYVHPDAANSLLTVMRTGLPPNIRDAIVVLEAYVTKGNVREKRNVPLPKSTELTAAVVRCIERRAFYPRKHAGICRSCGFSPVCDPQWCSDAALLDEHSKDRIKEDLENECVSS